MDHTALIQALTQDLREAVERLRHGQAAQRNGYRIGTAKVERYIGELIHTLSGE
jgi:hypothetical protein